MSPHSSNLRADFDLLLRAWNRHQDLRRNGADVAQLAASRFELDQLRFAG